MNKELDKTEEETALEKEFLDLKDKIDDKIQEKLAQAEKALDEAVKLSEKHGIPFYSSISFLGQGYTPTTFHDKFGDLSGDFICEVADMYYATEGDGWQHSAVC